MTISKLNIAKKENFATFHKGTTAITLNTQTGLFYTNDNGIIGSVQKIGRSRFAVKAVGFEREIMELLGGEMCALEDVARHLLTLANRTPEQAPAIETIESNESDAIAAEIVASENESLFVANDCDVDKYLTALQTLVLEFIANAYHTQANAYRNDIETAFANEGETYVGLALSGLFTSGKTRKVHGNYEPILTTAKEVINYEFAPVLSEIIATENTIEAIESKEVVVIEVPSLSEVDALTLECVISSVCGEVAPVSIETVATEKPLIATITKLECIGTDVVATYENGATRAKSFESYEEADANFEYVNGIWESHKQKAINTKEVERLAAIASVQSMANEQDLYPNYEIRLYRSEKIGFETVATFHSLLEWLEKFPKHFRSYSANSNRFLMSGMLYHVARVSNVEIVESAIKSTAIEAIETPVLSGLDAAVLECIYLSVCGEVAPSQTIEVPNASNGIDLDIFGIIETAAAALEGVETVQFTESVTPAIETSLAPVTTIEATAKYYSLPQYGIETSNLNIACEMLSDLCIYFTLVNDDIIFPETPKKPAKAKGVTVKVITPAIEVQPEVAPKNEYIPLPPIGSPEYLATLKERAAKSITHSVLPITPIMPQKPVKMPSLKVWDYSVTRNTLKLMREFLGKNKALLNAEKTEWYNEIYKAIEKECKKPIQDRMFMNDLIDYVELDILAIGETQSTCRVSLTQVQLSDGETSLYLTFSETIIHPTNGTSVKRLSLPNKIKTAPKLKRQIESNKALLKAAYLAVEAYQTKINKGYIKLYVPKAQK